VDAGVNVDGGYDAGMYLSRICLADLADITINELNSAKSFTSGRINQEVLLKSFGISRL
jgi:methenyltetrahydromethanopterin cyclohydrolase